ncbi:hypothetical protein [Salinibaculum salinum]|uniref:hypothetical protein n=1 Tax=Salinibaculum salinum TaxID=3131996 RepID=UPI0030ED00B6
MPSGPPISHTDNFKPTATGGDGDYSVPTAYEDHPEKTEYGSVTERFDGEIEIERPAETIAELRQETHLTAQLHEQNRIQQNSDWPFPNDSTTLFDVAILDVMDQALEIEGLSLDSHTVLPRRFRSYFLKSARKPQTLKEFHEYITESKPVLTELGYRPERGGPSYERLRRVLNEDIPAELEGIERGTEAFAAAVERATYSVYRNGIEVPPSVETECGFEAVTAPLYEKGVSRPTEKIALRNWVNLLLDETVDPLTFGRSEPQMTFRQYIGLLAASALYNCGVQTVPDISDYHYNRDLIPKGSGVGKYIRKDLPMSNSRGKMGDTAKRGISEQFDAAHRATLGIAEQYGFFNEPRSLAVDLYRIEWAGVENDLTINRPAKSENDNRSEWTYAVIGIIDTEARFTLGARWLPDKSWYPSAVRELTPVANEFVDVEALYADSELISGDLIDAFRELADSDWIVRAPNRRVIQKLWRYTPENYVGYLPSVSWNTSPKPAAVAYPKKGDNPSTIRFTPAELRDVDIQDEQTQTDLSNFDESVTTPASELPSLTDIFEDPETVDGVDRKTKHALYLTDRSLPDRSAAGIHFRYYQRWAIEETINQISNDYMPRIESGNEKLRLYGVNVAILFQNWHTLINRAQSPELGLRVDVTHQELLKAIEDVAFSNAD